MCLKNTNGQTLYGADIATIINKAVDNNEKYNVEKNLNGFYVENDENSIKVELTLLTTDKEGNKVEARYQMESLVNAGLNDFISSFSLTTFECTNIKYNSLGKVSKIFVKQIEI